MASSPSKNLLRKSANKASARKSPSGKSAKPTAIRMLANQTEHNRMQYQVGVEKVFLMLEQLEPQIARQAVSVFGDRLKAAFWLAEPRRTMRGGLSPIKAIAEGRRDDVIAELGRIEHGVFT